MADKFIELVLVIVGFFLLLVVQTSYAWDCNTDCNKHFRPWDPDRAACHAWQAIDENCGRSLVCSGVHLDPNFQMLVGAMRRLEPDLSDRGIYDEDTCKSKADTVSAMIATKYPPAGIASEIQLQCACLDVYGRNTNPSQPSSTSSPVYFFFCYGGTRPYCGHVAHGQVPPDQSPQYFFDNFCQGYHYRSATVGDEDYVRREFDRCSRMTNGD